MITKNEVESFNLKHVGRNEIDYLRKAINDSISVWKKNKVEGYPNISYCFGKIDSLICLNKEKNKLLTVWMGWCSDKRSFDGYAYFYGVKIKEKWYFFDGETQPIGRKDPKIPATFEQLSKIAFEDVFQYYLKRNEKGELEVDESIFSSLTNNGWAEGDEGIMPKTKEEWDQRYIREAAERRAKIDTNDYSKME